MSAPSVLVIGAGALGLSSAWQLVERGLDQITVVDADYPASGSSGLSVGFLQTQHLTPLNIELRAVAMRCFDELAAHHGLDVTRNGYVRVGFSSEDIDSFQRSVEIQRELGITHPRVLDRAQLKALVPDMFIDDVAGALYGPQDGFIDGHLYCGLLAQLLTDHGVQVVPKAAVRGADTTADGRHSVSTDRGALEADIVVNAAGAWAPAVAALFDTVVPLRAERHQAVIARLPASLPYTMPCVMNYSPGSGTEGIFFRHERPGQLVTGLHSLEPIGEVVDPDDYRRSNDLEFLEQVASRFEQRLPTLQDAQLGGGWAGIYPVSADGKPIVGPAPGRPTVIQAAGAGGAGIMLSPVIGRLVAEWILDGCVTSVSGGETLAPARLAGYSSGAAA